MIKNSIIYLSVFIVSASIICFEIVSTRISSVIFVSNYAFMILSLAILGLGVGGIYSYYKIKTGDNHQLAGIVQKIIMFLGLALVFFICAIILFKITQPFIYFALLFIPFFLAGIFYAQIFKFMANQSFLVYAYDLLGAAVGSVAAIFLLDFFGAANSVLFLAILVFSIVRIMAPGQFTKALHIGLYAILMVFTVLLIINGENPLLGKIPIGNFPEKDYYHVYENAASISHIEDSRWSIHGRSDLVRYANQDVVKQLFVDGAAGTQMFRFSGDKSNPGQMLANLLSGYSTTVPLMLLRPSEKNSMLVIGPGGGKEVLTGLLSGVESITGVEINPDFVNIVKSHKDFNGGIYTDFPNIDIVVKEGRHYIKKTRNKFDILLMALPSTEQLQNIDNMAMSENYLLTQEALSDYIHILTAEGQLVFTVHNRWELIRLLVTTLYAFRDMGISEQDALNHIMLLADDYAPTMVVKKNPYNLIDIDNIQQIVQKLPQTVTAITYMPHLWNRLPNTPENMLLKTIHENRITLEEYIAQNDFDISPVTDESPYFYKISRGIPGDIALLLAIIILVNVLLIFLPVLLVRKKQQPLNISIVFFAALGVGFMLIEISIFQKLILFLGSPTIALSLLLCSLLVSMGVGSFVGNHIYPQHIKKRIQTVSFLILLGGSAFFFLSQYVLTLLLQHGLLVRALVTVFLIFPFGFLLGILFPTCIQLVKRKELAAYIPWMYGINGTMSVLGSILAVVFSMLWGFTPAFFIGLLCYLLVFVVSRRLT